MKIIIIVVLVMVGISFNSCKKKPFDDRNKFVGKCQITNKQYVLYSVNNYQDTTYAISVEGNVDYGDLSNQITIDIKDSENKGNNKYLNVEISKNGKISGGSFILGSFSGFIKNNNIEFSISYSSLGGGTKTTYIGLMK